MDIYYQVDMMDSNILPTKSSIESRFCTWKPKVFWKRQNGSAVQQRAMERTGYKNQAEFKKSLKLFYFGRSIKDTGMERNNEYIVYTVDPTQEQLYAIRKGARYSELLNCPTLVEGCEIEFTREKCPKLDRLLTLCEQDFHDSSVMIYCMYIEAQEKLKEYLEQSGRKVCILNGNTKEEPRKQLIKDFNDGVYDVIITNIKKSLNLYNGDVCIFYTVEGNPAKMEQIRGRIDRNVDNKLKTFVLLLYSHTLEYTLFTKTASTRSKDSKDLTIDFTSAVDYFMDSMRDDDSSE
jgi:ERCC4-related helicase